MNSSAKRFAMLVCLATGLIAATIVSAQTAYRCDSNGQTVYSDKPCLAGKAVVGTQETPEQKAAAQAANAQMRNDTADLNKRLADREKLAAQERAAARKAAGKPIGASAKGKAASKAKSVRAAKKPKSAKSSSKKNKAKPANGDTVTSSPR